MLKLLKLPNHYALKKKIIMKLAHEIISDHVFRAGHPGTLTLLHALFTVLNSIMMIKPLMLYADFV